MLYDEQHVVMPRDYEGPDRTGVGEIVSMGLATGVHRLKDTNGSGQGHKARAECRSFMRLWVSHGAWRNNDLGSSLAKKML